MLWILLIQLTVTYSCPPGMACPAPTVQTQRQGPYPQARCEQMASAMRKAFGATDTDTGGIRARTTAQLSCVPEGGQ